MAYLDDIGLSGHGSENQKAMNPQLSVDVDPELKKKAQSYINENQRQINYHLDLIASLRKRSELIKRNPEAVLLYED